MFARSILTLVFQAQKWAPSLGDPYRGLVIWPVPENIEATVTLFRDHRHDEYEDKEWTFVVEDVGLFVVFILLYDNMIYKSTYFLAVL